MYIPKLIIGGDILEILQRRPYRSIYKDLQFKIFLRKLSRKLSREEGGGNTSFYIYTDSSFNYRNIVTTNMGLRERVFKILREAGYMVYKYNGSPSESFEDECIVIRW